ncbi:MAG: hypothetical protein JWQ68_1478 [Cryobacterium sp.]|jgi:hypothetical protein|nr:hypothetical protein [Cryobacterium sp.]
MAGELWWVPSAVVLAVVAVLVTLGVLVARRRSRARVRSANAAAAELARTAAISLVRADDAVQAAADELGFAIAQFGEQATRDFAAALGTSRRQLRDAFALQQKLDDAMPDTDSQRRRWNEQIIELADEATTRLAQHTRGFDARRGAERDAPLKLEQLDRRLGRVADRVKSGATSLQRLRLTYSEDALAAISTNAERARAALDRALTSTEAAAADLAAGPGRPVGDRVRDAEEALFHATTLLDAIETGEDQLHIGLAACERAIEAAETELAEARELRDRHEESEASGNLNQVIVHANQVLAELRAPGRLKNPSADLATLRRAMDGLDSIRSEARNRQLRLENARSALHGAMLAARSQISVTRDFITVNRAKVGAAARTRLAEAERQLSAAEAEAETNPVTALDTARRAMTHATDADALARFDTH